MNIKKYASKPQLIEVVLDNSDLLEKYGEPITFYTYDVVGMSTYFEFFNARSNGEYINLEKMIRKLVLDKDGKPVLESEEDLPIDIAAEAVNSIGELLGKSQHKTSNQVPGEQQK